MTDIERVQRSLAEREAKILSMEKRAQVLRAELESDKKKVAAFCDLLAASKEVTGVEVGRPLLVPAKGKAVKRRGAVKQSVEMAIRAIGPNSPDRLTSTDVVKYLEEYDAAIGLPFDLEASRTTISRHVQHFADIGLLTMRFEAKGRSPAIYAYNGESSNHSNHHESNEAATNQPIVEA